MRKAVDVAVSYARRLRWLRSGQELAVGLEWESGHEDTEGTVQSNWVACQLSCQVVCQGPASEAGQRSHADDLAQIARRAGIPKGRAVVRLRHAGRGFDVLEMKGPFRST